MKTVPMACALLFALSCAALAETNSPATLVKGTIRKIEGTTIKVNDTLVKETDKTVVMIAGKQAKLSDLAVGQNVTVREEQNVAVRIEVHVKK